MKKFFLFFFSSLSISAPVIANPQTNYFVNFETCARYRAQQMTHAEAAKQLGLKPSTWKKNPIKDDAGLLKGYCGFYKPNSLK